MIWVGFWGAQHSTCLDIQNGDCCEIFTCSGSLHLINFYFIFIILSVVCCCLPFFFVFWFLSLSLSFFLFFFFCFSNTCALSFLIRRRLHTAVCQFSRSNTLAFTYLICHSQWTMLCLSVCLSNAMNKHNMTLFKCVCVCVWCGLLLVPRGLSTKRICPIITFINAREWAIRTMYRVHMLCGTYSVGTLCLYGTCSVCTNNIDKNWVITRIMYHTRWLIIIFWVFVHMKLCTIPGYFLACRILKF